MAAGTRAFVFPGQGSQEVGMGVALAEAFPVARHVLEEVDEALGQHLSRLMREGPESELNLTRNTQPALMAVSVAVARVLAAEGGPDLSRPGGALFVAGHSLGEYSALASTGALSVTDTARLLRRRGEAMQAAVPVGVGAMAALLGVDLAVAEQIVADAAEGEVCACANDNGAGQVVVSGHRAAVERAVALVPQRGGKRGMLLPVSAPFHCPLMQPAAEAMAEALASAAIRDPAVPVVANITAAPVAVSLEIAPLLVRQVTGLVRWRESVLRMQAEGVTELVELGVGKVLGGLNRRIAKDIATAAVGTPAEVEAFLRQA